MTSWCGPCHSIRGQGWPWGTLQLFINALTGRLYFPEGSSIRISQGRQLPSEFLPSQKNQNLRGTRDIPEAYRPLILEALGERAGLSLSCCLWRKGYAEGRGSSLQVASWTKEAAGPGSSPLGHAYTEPPDTGSFRPLSLNVLSLQGTGRESLLPGVGEAWSMEAT